MSQIERTLCIVKPDAISHNHGGQILAILEEAGLRPVALKRVRLSRQEAEGFYYVHRERPFFGSLIEFMSSGSVMMMVLEGENAVARLRDLMGPTDPANAGEGMLRKRFGTNIERNAVHGSDSLASAASEVAYFFSDLDLARA